MGISFCKYHGTGNDFILIDDRNGSFDESDSELVSRMCSRRFGIGADGLILLRDNEEYDFEMVYFNSNGKVSSMCGNGGRCIVQFALDLNIFEDECEFIAVDGVHKAVIVENSNIKLKMNSVGDITKKGDALILDTGSPHYVTLVDDVNEVDVFKRGQTIRYSDEYKKHGINVNFVEANYDSIKVATYERGVEEETYSCGTGVTAAALSMQSVFPDRFMSPVKIETKGGVLNVSFEQHEDGSFRNVWLEGPAERTFEGVWPR